MTFRDAFEKALPFTLLDDTRSELLWNEAKSAPAGAFVEVGVFRGGSAMLLRAAAPDRDVHLFDTFTGHPATQVEGLDGPDQPPGRFDETDAVSVLARVDQGSGRVTVHVGEYPRFHGDWHQPIALAHIDVDLYRSTKDALDRMVPMLVAGGVLICDDWTWCPGAKKAVEEYAASDSSVTLELPGTGQAILRKAA